jgi:hypothetical protein
MVLDGLVHEHTRKFKRESSFLSSSDNMWSILKEEHISNLKRLELIEVFEKSDSELDLRDLSRNPSIDTNSNIYLNLTKFGRAFISFCVC